MTNPKWLEWAKTLQATAQNGLQFTEGPFDKERYKVIQQVAAEILAEHSNLDSEKIRDLFDKEVGYATPKVDVRGAAFRDNKILLVRENMDEGRWTLPGGWADVNETPSQAVEREVFEEAGFRARVSKLAAIYDRTRQGTVKPYPYHVYKLFFICDLIGGAPADSIETAGADFFAETALPELSIARVNPRQIARMFEHYRNPALSADFD